MPLPTIPAEGSEDWYAYAQAIHTALNAVEGATDDQTDAEIETAVLNEIPEVSQVEAEAGTETENRTWSPLRVKEAIDALASSSMGSAFSSSTHRRFVEEWGDDSNPGDVPDQPMRNIEVATKDLPIVLGSSGQGSHQGTVVTGDGEYHPASIIPANREQFFETTGATNNDNRKGGVTIFDDLLSGVDYMFDYVGVGGQGAFTDYAHMLRFGPMRLVGAGIRSLNPGFGYELNGVKFEDCTDYGAWIEGACVTFLAINCSGQGNAQSCIHFNLNSAANSMAKILMFQGDDNGEAVIKVTNNSGARNVFDFEFIQAEVKDNGTQDTSMHQSIILLDTGASAGNPITCNIGPVRAHRDVAFTTNADARIVRIINTGSVADSWKVPTINWKGSVAARTNGVFGAVLGNDWEGEDVCTDVGKGIMGGQYRGMALTNIVPYMWQGNTPFYHQRRTGAPTIGAPLGEHARCETDSGSYRWDGAAWVAH